MGQQQEAGIFLVIFLAIYHSVFHWHFPCGAAFPLKKKLIIIPNLLPWYQC